MNRYIQEANQQFISAYNRYPIILDHGEGMYLYDIDGKRYLDFGSGIGVCGLGYHDPNYTRMLQGQIEKLLHTSNLFYNVPAIEAAKQFNQAANMEQVFFTNSGAEAIEGAIKIAKKYHFLKYKNKNGEIIAMKKSFHGRSMGALSITGQRREQYGAVKGVIIWNCGRTYGVAVQLVAVLAVAVLYWKKLFPLRTGAGGKPVLEKKILILWGKICLACIPAAIVGVLFDSVFEALFYHPVPVATALIVFGIAMIVIERWNRGREPVMKTIDDLTVPAVLIIGCFQLLAAVSPGTSRSGATIVGALLLGVSRTAASEFTFYLAVPVMFGASFLRMLQYGFQFTQMELLILLVGMAAAFLVSLAVIHALLGYIRKHDFQVFGWYRIVLGGLILLLNGAGLISSL